MIQNGEHFLKEKTMKIINQAHAFKGLVSSYNVKVLKSFDLELQLK